MKKLFFFSHFVVFTFLAQTTFHESWSNYTLTTYTTPSSASSHTLPHSGWQTFWDGWTNTSGSSIAPNMPFHDPLLKNSPFAIYYSPSENDTFLVGTSWIDSASRSIDRWIISPPITVYSPYAVFSWMARSPDPNFRDGYSLYILPSTLTISHPSVITSLSVAPSFSISDNNTQGGGEFTQWTKRSTNISSYYLQSFRFAIRHQSKNRFQLWLDDFRVDGVPFLLDAGIPYYAGNSCLAPGSPDSVRVLIKNFSAAEIKTLSMAYQINNSTPYVQTFTLNTPLYFESEKMLSFSLPYSCSSAGTYTLKVWILSLNQQSDDNPANDTLKQYIYVSASAYARKSLVETAMSAKNKLSPGIMQYITTCTGSSVIPVCMHTNDSLEKPQTTLWQQTYGARVPDFVVNREFIYKNQTFTTSYQKYCPMSANQTSLSPLNVSFSGIAYDSASRVVQATVSVSCAASLWGDFRLHVFLTENNVSGALSDTTANGWNQLNGFYTIPWSFWFNKGYYDPVAMEYVMNAWQYKHQFVFQNNITPWNGLAGLVPGNGTSQGQTYAWVFTYTLPPVPSYARINQAENTHLVAFVEEVHTDIKKNKVWNAASIKIWNKPEIVSVPERAMEKEVYIYPNPCVDEFFISHTEEIQSVRLYSSSGGQMEVNFTKNRTGILKVYVNEIPEGVYLLEIRTVKGNIVRKKIIRY